MIARKLEVSVISDIHLATHACRAKKVLKYLKSITPDVLVLNGDIFDHIIHRAKWLAKLGAATYGLLTVLNQPINVFLRTLGFKELIIYKSVKQKLIKEKPELSDFEQAVSRTAAGKDCRTVICGHTHEPKDKLFIGEKTLVRYMNCGDWIENFTAAEYDDGKWNLFHFNEDEEEQIADDPDIPDSKEIFQSLFRELAIVGIQ